MSAHFKPARDSFRLSLGGIAVKSAYAFIPAIADDPINAAWDARLSRDPEDQPDMTREIEDFLARYFAPGYRRAA